MSSKPSGGGLRFLALRMAGILATVLGGGGGGGAVVWFSTVSRPWTVAGGGGVGGGGGLFYAGAGLLVGCGRVSRPNSGKNLRTPLPRGPTALAVLPTTARTAARDSHCPSVRLPALCTTTQESARHDQPDVSRSADTVM